MKRLSGKVALVTGGSRGIGAAIAKRLAEEGADVAITYTATTEKAHEVVHVIESSGVRGLAFRAGSVTSDQEWLESGFLQRQSGNWKIVFIHSTRVPWTPPAQPK